MAEDEIIKLNKAVALAHFDSASIYYNLSIISSEAITKIHIENNNISVSSDIVIINQISYTEKILRSDESQTTRYHYICALHLEAIKRLISKGNIDELVHHFTAIKNFINFENSTFHYFSALINNLAIDLYSQSNFKISYTLLNLFSEIFLDSNISSNQDVISSYLLLELLSKLNSKESRDFFLIITVIKDI